MSWVLDESDERLGRRLVLLALANYAHDDGSEAWPSIATLSRATRLSESQARRCLRQLEQAGAIEKTGTSRYGTGVYTVVMHQSCQDDPPGILPVPPLSFRPDPPGRMTPDPSLDKPSKEQPSIDLVEARVPTTVARKPVSSIEAWTAKEILAYWNGRTEQRLAAPDWLAKIISRIREHPELSVDNHCEIINANLAHPWWTGPATPSVVYGNAAQFERAIMAQDVIVEGGQAALKVALAAIHQEEDS